MARNFLKAARTPAWTALARRIFFMRGSVRGTLAKAPSTREVGHLLLAPVGVVWREPRLGKPGLSGCSGTGIQ